MNQLAHASSFCLLVVATAVAQGMPEPAPELQKLAGLVGTWSGSGTMTEPGGAKTKWTTSGTCRWALNGHFLQMDWRIDFDGQEVPMIKHGFLGWDREHQRYVDVKIDNGGAVGLDEVHVMGDGSLVEFLQMNHPGMAFALRSTFLPKGEQLRHTIDVLMPDGPSLAMLDATFTRGGKGYAGGDAAPFPGAKPSLALAKLNRSAGVYKTEGEMVVLPGQPAVKITGTDAFATRFGGMVLHGHTEGEAEGLPGQYVGEVYWGHDAKQDCLVGVYVSNMGEAMAMQARWTADGRLLATTAALYQGQPMVQRMLMDFTDTGAAKGAVAHSILGTAAPFESFRATYTPKK